MARRRKADAPAEDRRAPLIDRLTQHALGTIELSATQLRAIELLLKSLPGLEGQGTGEGESEVVVKGALVWQPPVV